MYVRTNEKGLAGTSPFSHFLGNNVCKNAN